MKSFLLKNLEWITLLVLILSAPVMWELWRRPLQSYQEREDITVVRESNCRKAMMTGAAGCAVWGGLLLLRWTLKGQRRRPSLRWMPWALAVLMIAAIVRVVMAMQTYPWFYD